MKHLPAAILASLASALLIPAGPAWAGNEEDFLAGRTKDCAGCQLANVNLKRADLAGANLSKANLSGANLHRVHVFQLKRLVRIAVYRSLIVIGDG